MMDNNTTTVYITLILILAVHPVITNITVSDNVGVIVEGNNIIITCEATGIPLPTIVWIFSGTVLMSDSNVNFYTTDITVNGDISRVTERLTIMNASRELTGIYKCSASNSVGNDTSSGIHIAVQCKFVMMLLKYTV